MDSENNQNGNDLRNTQDDVEIDLTLFGNKYTLIQVITLMSYIRNVIRSNKPRTITLEIGKNVTDRTFEFLVNDQVADNLIPKDKVEIN